MVVPCWISIRSALSWMRISCGNTKQMDQGSFDFEAFQSMPWILCQLGGQLTGPLSILNWFSRELQLSFCSRSPELLGTSLTTTGWWTSLSPAFLRLAAASSVTSSLTTAGTSFAFQALPVFLLPAESATFLAFLAKAIDLEHISSIRLNATENSVRMTAFFFICNWSTLATAGNWSSPISIMRSCSSRVFKNSQIIEAGSSWWREPFLRIAWRWLKTEHTK